jgi:hypothetical protein
MAAASIANIVKSSLGPVGLDKMLVDDIGVSICLHVMFITLKNKFMNISLVFVRVLVLEGIQKVNVS